jgi:hypothetical protein
MCRAALASSMLAAFTSSCAAENLFFAVLTNLEPRSIQISASIAPIA